MSTAITSSTSTSTEFAALLPGKSTRRGAAKAPQAASASVAAPIAPIKSRLRIAGLLCALVPGWWHTVRCGNRLSPERPVDARAHEGRQAQPAAHERLPVVTPHSAPASPCAAGAGEIVIEGKAESAVVHAEFFAGRNPQQRHDVIPAVVPDVWIARVVDEVHRVPDRLGVKRAGDLLGRGVVGKAQECGAHRGREILELLSRHCREASPLGFVDPVILAEQRGAGFDRPASEQAASGGGGADFERQRNVADRRYRRRSQMEWVHWISGAGSGSRRRGFLLPDQSWCPATPV